MSANRFESDALFDAPVVEHDAIESLAHAWADFSRNATTRADAPLSADRTQGAAQLARRNARVPDE